MWCAIKINKTIEKCVPVRWIKDFKYSQAYNYGLEINAKHIVFCSPDVTANPSFENNLQRDYIPNATASYIGNILRFFGKLMSD